ncbi:MAG: hypothetical protein EPN47_13655 [Acidobacteria bacterium]|nr:MAG: hypothetical protein EPN47_13655 [Acidobacteriota bacterium]
MSLVDELRAIRGGPKAPDVRPGLLQENERPWKSDIERVEQTLQAALQAISQLSGVVLPEGVVQDGSGSVSRLDCSNLKDRIRNDIEAFSVTTVSQISKQAELQARAALEVIQSEMEGRIEKVVDGYRDKLREQIEPQQFEINVAKQSQERVSELVRAQTDEFARWVWLTCKGTGTPIPLQIEKLLEPYVQEATSLMTGSIQQKIHDLLIEQEKLVEERFKGTADTLQNHIVTIEQAAQQACERNADAVTKVSTERLNAAADEVAKSFESRIRDHVEGAFRDVQPRLDESTAALLEKLHEEQDKMAQDFIRRMEVLTSEMEATKGPEFSARVEQSVANAMNSSLEQLHETTEGALQRIQESGQSVQASVEQGVARVAEMIGGEGQDLSSFRVKFLSDSKSQISSMVQEAVGAMEPHVIQLTEEKLEAAGVGIGKARDEAVKQFESRLMEVSEGQYRDLLERIQKDAGEASAHATAEVRNTSETLVQEISEKADSAAAVLKKQQEESEFGIESSVNDSLESFRRQLAEITRAGLEGQRKTIADSLDDLQKRLTLAAEALVADDPIPA